MRKWKILLSLRRIILYAIVCVFFFFQRSLSANACALSAPKTASLNAAHVQNARSDFNCKSFPGTKTGKRNFPNEMMNGIQSLSRWHWFELFFKTYRGNQIAYGLFDLNRDQFWISFCFQLTERGWVCRLCLALSFFFCIVAIVSWTFALGIYWSCAEPNTCREIQYMETVWQ